MSNRDVIVDTRPNGRLVNIPVEVDEAKMDQYVKRFIEIASYNLQDGSGVVSLFRSFHGGDWTLGILRAVIDELEHPRIRLEIDDSAREKLQPFFKEILQRHEAVDDADFGYPHDRSQLPM